jgi:hypothetical protein
VEQERIDALRRQIAGYRQRLGEGVAALEAQRLLRLIMEVEVELERLIKGIR